MKRSKGITLVALVITVIIMLILAGVAMSLSIGENGIFKKASQGANLYEEVAKKEKNDLTQVEEYLKGQITPNEELPDNTPQTEAGTLVKIPDKWLIQTPSYVEDGKEIISSKQIATVNAVNVGNGEMVPVPIGFYYVGGTLSTGVVISDNEVDKNKFAGIEDVPSGLKQNEEGNIEHEIVGNQFVWIPCNLEGYVKTDWGQGSVTNRSDSYWDSTVDQAGKIQTEKYDGFYVARFEAGLASSIAEFTTTQFHTGSNQIYNQEGIPQSKPGIAPWNFIDWEHSQVNAEKMYHTNSVKSGLITGTQWDVMINWMTDKNEPELTSSDWGNYATVTPKITLGRISYSYRTNNKWYQDAFTSEWIVNTNKPLGAIGPINNEKGYLWSTGASEEAKKKNIYDVAGNLWEWTEETTLGVTNTIQQRVMRGGSYNSSLADPVCYRGGTTRINYTTHTQGFRTVLYIK